MPETKGFLGSFIGKFDHSAEVEASQKASQEKVRQLEQEAENQKLQADLAPKLADMALGEAIFTKSGVDPNAVSAGASMSETAQRLSQMKRKLAEKIKAPKQSATGALAEFNNLPVQKLSKQTESKSADKPKEAEQASGYKVDPVLNFLDQVSDLEKRERDEKEKQEKEAR